MTRGVRAPGPAAGEALSRSGPPEPVPSAAVATVAPSLAQAFQVAAAELGMCSAARLFARELLDAGGPTLLSDARDRLGRAFPVFDFVAAAPTRARAAVDVGPALAALGSLERLLVVGIEADFLDALVPALPGVRVGLLVEGEALRPDLARVLANYGGRVEGIALGTFQAWAGSRSALLTFVYGSDGHVAHVPATWLRVSGADVRTQFRALVGWDILGEPLDLYPRWLVETRLEDFSHLARGAPPSEGPPTGAPPAGAPPAGAPPAGAPPAGAPPAAAPP